MDLIMPLLEYAVPNASNWENILVGPFRVGHFFGTLLTFIIIMLVIFLIIRAARKYHIE